MRTSKRNWLKRLLGYGILIGVLCAGVIVWQGTQESITKADIAVVLGNEILPSGVPSPRLAGRLDRAVDLYKKELCDLIIVSGGVGKEGFDEAVSMQRYLLKKGIPEHAIIVDSNGYNTRATAKFTAGFLAQHGHSSAIAVTQYYHIPRTVLALEQEGVLLVGKAYARYFEWGDLLSTAREVPAYLYYYFQWK